MRRPPLGVLLVATLAFAACGEPSDHALGPQVPAQPARPPLAADLAPCPTATGVDSQITALFSGGNQTAALSKFANIVALLDSTPPGEDTATAQSHTLDLIGFTLQKYEAGTLNGGFSNDTQAQVVRLINGLLCFSGLPQGFSIGDLGSDGAWAILSSSTPDTTVTTGNLHAGLQVDSGSVTQTVLVTITRLPDSPGPLATQLDQYPLFYEFNVTPKVPFALPVLVGACQSQTLPDSVVQRLRIAHNVTTDSIQILPYAYAPFLDCTSVSLRSTNPLANLAMAGWHALTSLIGPAPLLAAAGGVGGTAKTFSPFGAVDTLLVMTPNSDTTQRYPVGDTVPSAPSVKVATPKGHPYDGLGVTFAVTGGGGTLTGGTTTTDASGVATVGTWALGSAAGLNTVTATGTPPYVGHSDITGSPLTFHATALPPTQVAFKQGPSGIVAGATMTPAVTVAIEDADGHVVTSSAASVTLGVTGGAATLQGTTTVSAVNGIATFSTLTVTKAGTWTLTASSSGLTSATSGPFTVTAAAASTIFAVAGDNQTATAGSAVAVPPAVRVTDQYGNPVSGVSVTFLPQNGGSVTGTPQTTDVSGTAAVGSWTLVAGTNYLLAETTDYYHGGTGLAGDPVTFTATGSTPSPLVYCPPSNGSGDPLTHAFYDSKYPGRSLSEVVVYLSSNAAANTPTPYTIQMTASLGGFNGTPIGTSTVTAYLRGNSSQNLPTNFVFPATATFSKNSTLAFQFTVLSNPNNATLTFNVGSCGVGNTNCKTSCPLVETTDASGTTSTFYRKGTSATIYGN
jgi:hypothetical protein